MKLKQLALLCLAITSFAGINASYYRQETGKCHGFESRHDKLTARLAAFDQMKQKHADPHWFDFQKSDKEKQVYVKQLRKHRSHMNELVKLSKESDTYKWFGLNLLLPVFNATVYNLGNYKNIPKGDGSYYRINYDNYNPKQLDYKNTFGQSRQQIRPRNCDDAIIVNMQDDIGMDLNIPGYYKNHHSDNSQIPSEQKIRKDTAELRNYLVPKAEKNRNWYKSRAFGTVEILACLTTWFGLK